MNDTDRPGEIDALARLLPRSAHRLGVALFLLLAMRFAALADTTVLTQHNDSQRTGANLTETVLAPNIVSKDRFGWIFSRLVDGQLYAQPLIADSGDRHLLICATMHNSVYAFDADDPNASAPIWHTTLAPAVPVGGSVYSPNPAQYPGNIDIEIGVLSTPVIDPDSGALYVVCLTQASAPNPNGFKYEYDLHKLDVTTGREMPASPVTITGRVPGSGYGADRVLSAGPYGTNQLVTDRADGNLLFNPDQLLQRPGLLLSHGCLYMAFGSHQDTPPYHGWVFAYDAQNLTQRGVFCVTPDGGGGGLWQSGAGLVADDAGNVYFQSGNGQYPASTVPPNNCDESMVKLTLSQASLAVTDSFTPSDRQDLNKNDEDLGSSGPMLLPGTHLLVGGGKSGVIYVVDTNKMGGTVAGDTQIHQEFQATSTDPGPNKATPWTHHIHGSPVFWSELDPSDPAHAAIMRRLYVWGENDRLRVFSLAERDLFDTNPRLAGHQLPDGMPGAMLAISAHGSTADTGILWASTPLQDAIVATVPGELSAFDASSLTELWNSTDDPAYHQNGYFAKFCAPTVANGKVYMATFSNRVDVYGPLTTPGRIVRPLPIAGSSVISIEWRDGSLLTPNARGLPAASSASRPPWWTSMLVGGTIPEAFWNRGFAPQGRLSGLLDNSGAATSAQVTWRSERIIPLDLTSRLEVSVLQEAISAAQNPVTVTFTGLPKGLATNGYDAYVYIGAASGGAPAQGQYKIKPGGLIGLPRSGTYHRASGTNGDYIVFENLKAAGFTLIVRGTGSKPVQIAGIQIVSRVPQPAPSKMRLLWPERWRPTILRRKQLPTFEQIDAQESRRAQSPR